MRRGCCRQVSRGLPVATTAAIAEDDGRELGCFEAVAEEKFKLCVNACNSLCSVLKAVSLYYRFCKCCNLSYRFCKVQAVALFQF
ncbi:hypothetical protein PVAP13_4KG008958 [Panicum virgatum]|uniref:Uncharacterized protein n=1 Tax=Panicum virgatum TaxID=38727 RepID=A0A8T0THY0_PANVG|nr:hypothetical protein PVAP13_4KG008958 [Panicum virgatum]